MSSDGIRGSDPVGHYPAASLRCLLLDRGPDHKVEERAPDLLVWQIPGAQFPVRLRRVQERREWHVVVVPARPSKKNRAVILDAVELEMRTFGDLRHIEERARFGHGDA